MKLQNPLLIKLKEDLDKLQLLLNEPEEGIGSWNIFVGQTWKRVVELWDPKFRPSLEKKYKIRHKKDKWTGTFKIEDFTSSSWGSHRQGITVHCYITQDTHDEEGKYVEDPNVNNPLEELEFLGRID